jgi:hypothetical protein
MKVTAVPAQVTTVEDRIVGSLGFSQLVLVVAPVFIAAGLFAVLPPFMGSAVYKYVIMGILAFLCCVLAIRIRGKILATWLIVILRYNLRPKYYLFDKNVATLRENYPMRQEKEEVAPVKTKKQNIRPRLGIPETAKVLAIIENPAAKIRFETGKKGNLHARLTEIEEQN